MQGVILAIAKARQTFDRDGSEAGLVKVSCLLATPTSMDFCFQREESVLCWQSQTLEGTIRAALANGALPRISLSAR